MYPKQIILTNSIGENVLFQNSSFGLLHFIQYEGWVNFFVFLLIILCFSIYCKGLCFFSVQQIGDFVIIQHLVCLSEQLPHLHRQEFFSSCTRVKSVQAMPQEMRIQGRRQFRWYLFSSFEEFSKQFCSKYYSER